MNKKAVLAWALALLPYAAALSQSQADDPVIMTINGEPDLRSEFEYSYNKNNSEGVIDKKTIEEYVDLFVNFKLKVCAALDAKYDTLTSFQQEFRQYRDQQLRPAMVTNAMLAISENKIARILKEHRMVAKSGRKGRPKAPKPTEEQYIEENLIKDKFGITIPNHLWCSDITELKCKSGKLYACGINGRISSKKPLKWP
jgi:hypothetical protein